MDEPLSNLDAKLRVQTRAEILKLQDRLGTTTIYVTHDQVEAMTMGDRIAVMNLGVLQQVGTPEQLYQEPANLFVAGFIGSPPMNLVPAVVVDRRRRRGPDRRLPSRAHRLQQRQARRPEVRRDGSTSSSTSATSSLPTSPLKDSTAVKAKLPVEQKLESTTRPPFSVPRDRLYLFEAETEERVRK